MNNVLNLNTTWTVGNFLKYIESNFSGAIIEWHGSLDMEDRDVLRTMESPVVMF